MASILTALGRAITTARLLGNAQGLPVNIGWGTGSGTAAAADTTLFTEDGGGNPAYARMAGTPSQQTTTTASDTYQVVGTLVASSAKTITNAGLFDAAAGGKLFVKGDFAGIPLAAGEGIQFTFTVQYS